MASMSDAKLQAGDRAKWDEICAKNYAEQAKWFLNAFWEDFKDNDQERESVFQRCLTCQELDIKSAEGNELDDFKAHQFLETLGETHTVRELREKLKKIDIDMNGKMALTEYLLFKYDKPVARLVSPQADPAEVKTATEKVQAAQAQVSAMRERQAELKQALESVKKAEAEQKAALAELQREEEAYNTKMKDLEEKSQSGGAVKRNKAAAELAMLKAEDPLPLRRAKITSEAAIRKLEKERKKAEEAEAVAAQALDAAQEAMREAQEYLDDVKSRVGSSEGTFWWLDREMEEQRKYLPQSKGGVARRV